MRNLMRANVVTYSPVVHPWKTNYKNSETKWEICEKDNSFNIEMDLRKKAQEQRNMTQENVNF